jgi:hypothetical protein
MYTPAVAPATGKTSMQRSIIAAALSSKAWGSFALQHTSGSGETGAHLLIKEQSAHMQFGRQRRAAGLFVSQATAFAEGCGPGRGAQR